jgi:hypothetical protein
MVGPEKFGDIGLIVAFTGTQAIASDPGASHKHPAADVVEPVDTQDLKS